MTAQEHYSLRWNNHQSHILRAFDTLLQTKTLVDVTLVCAETSIRAHKVVLSACSPFFQRVFSETPCKHPVIVLKDFRGWVVQAIVDFMYRGEISVPQERLQMLIQAGESLQVRGLVDHPVAINTPTPAASPEDFNIMDTSLVSPESPPLASPGFGSGALIAQGGKLLIPPQVFADPSLNMVSRDHCTSPTPRRKQARPRRRSGECGPQDLSKPSTPNPKDRSEDTDGKCEDIKCEDYEVHEIHDSPGEDEKSKTDAETPEDLSKSQNENKADLGDTTKLISLKEVRHKSLTRPPHYMPPFASLTPPPSFHLNNNPPLAKHLKAESEDGRTMDGDDSVIEQMDLSLAHPMSGVGHAVESAQHRLENSQNFNKPSGGGGGSAAGKGGGGDYMPNPLNFHPHFNQSDHQRHPSPLPFPPMPALALTSPHNAPFGLFPPGIDPSKMYNPLMELSDPRAMHPDHPPPAFLKKKLARAKSQHSAPRGGPPRSWTNAELTKALEHVWNKKMTTSQASRIFGIPYNSLLMYVRGKYGKSLKLEQLRKDCISGPPIEIIQRGISGHMTTTKERPKDPPKEGENSHQPRSSSSEPDVMTSPSPFFGSFPPGFYPDFAEGFPRLPLDMSTLLANERPPPGGGQMQMPPMDDDCRSNGSKQSAEEDFQQPLALNRGGSGGGGDPERRDLGPANNAPLPKPCVRL